MRENFYTCTSLETRYILPRVTWGNVRVTEFARETGDKHGKSHVIAEEAMRIGKEK